MAVATRMIPPTPTPRGRVSNMFPGVKRSTISVKLAGKSAWSVSDLVNAANFLDATPDELMNDAFMNELGMEKNQDQQGVLVGTGTPRYLVRPEAGENGTASAGVARPRSFVAMVPRWDSNQILMILILLWLHLQFQKSGNHVETLEG